MKTFYHASSKDFHLRVGDEILPPSETGNLREDFRKKNLGVVFVTTSLHSAKSYSKKIGNPVIFEVTVRAEDFIGLSNPSICNEFIAFKAKIKRILEV